MRLRSLTSMRLKTMLLASLLALGVFASLALGAVRIYHNQFEGKGDAKALDLSGKGCKAEVRGKKGQLGVSTGKGGSRCRLRLPVFGDAVQARPHHRRRGEAAAEDTRADPQEGLRRGHRARGRRWLLRAPRLPREAQVQPRPPSRGRGLPDQRQGQQDRQGRRQEQAHPPRARGHRQRQDEQARRSRRSPTRPPTTCRGRSSRSCSARRAAPRTAPRSGSRTSGSRSRIRRPAPPTLRTVGMSTDTLEKPRGAGPGEGLGGNWLVIVRNDDHNTFDHVAKTLARVIPGIGARRGLPQGRPDPLQRPGDRLVRAEGARRALLGAAPVRRPDDGPARAALVYEGRAAGARREAPMSRKGREVSASRPVLLCMGKRHFPRGSTRSGNVARERGAPAAGHERIQRGGPRPPA